MAAYPHRVEDARDGFFGSAIYSRLPVDDEVLLDIDGFPAVQAGVRTPGGTVTVTAVHTLQPLAGLDVLRRQLATLGRLADDVEGPHVLAVDFNATRQHRPLRDLLDHGLRDAHMDRGRGLARTSPADRPFQPFALLDHVLVSDGLVVRAAGEAVIPGSDHRAVTATIALSPPRRGEAP